MSDSVLITKFREFATDIIFLCRKLEQRGVESASINELIRCATSVSDSVCDAQCAQCTEEFISILKNVHQTCNESEDCLLRLYANNSLAETDFADFHDKCVELRQMLVSTVTTLKSK